MADDFKSGANIEMVVNPFADQPSIAGRYAVFTEIGSGPLGRVYIADDKRHTGQKVAIKVLHARMSTDFDDPSCLRRFVRAARTAAQLDLPGVVPILAIEEVVGDGQTGIALVQTFETWPTLGALIESGGALPAGVAARVVGGIATVLDLAHDEDILHLDLHPGNVFVSPKGEVRISDFAIRGSFQNEVVPEAPETGEWLPPEQKTGGRVGRFSDVYSLGLVLQYVLTAEPPDPTSSTPLPNALDLVVERATRPDATDRLPDMQAFLHALKAPGAYRTPIPIGNFVTPTIASPSPLGLAVQGTPVWLWLAVATGCVLLAVICSGVLVLLGLSS